MAKVPGQLVRILAWRRIADRPLRSGLTAAGVAAGVALLFSILSLNSQLAADVRDTAAVLAGPRLLQVTPSSPGGLPDGLAGRLATDDRVASAAPLVLARSTVSNGSHMTGVIVLGLTGDAAALAPEATETIEQSGSPAAGGLVLRANPRRTTVTVIALLLPMATVITTAVSFDAGLNKIGRLARTVITAPLNVDADSYVGGPGGSVASQALAPAHQTVLEAVPGVRAVLAYENANISLPDQSHGIIYAIPLAAAQRAGASEMVNIPRLAADPGAFTQALTNGQIAASHSTARSLHLQPGSRVTLPTPTGPRVFTVGALFDDWAFQGTFYIDLDTYRTVWGDDGAYRYAIVPTAGTSLDALRRRIDTAVTEAAMPAQVRTRGQAVAQLEASTASLLPLIRGISLACLVFSALALANAAFTAVKERRWQFGLQRTLGMSSRQISWSLALEAIGIGLIGTIGAAVLGVGLGIFTIRVLAHQLATTLPYAVPWTLVAASTLLGVAIALGATLHPRRVAKRLSIIETLRFD